MSTSDPSGGAQPGSGSEPQSPSGPPRSEQYQQPQATAAAAPGWYADPQSPGQQRWWDGGRWTEHVHPQAPGAAGPGPGQGAYEPYGPAYAGAAAVSNPRQIAMFAHLSAIAGLLIGGLTFVGPLILYMVKKDDDPFVAEHGREALNFNLSILIYMVALLILTFVLLITIIGSFITIFAMVGVGIAWLVFTIIAAVKANNGERYRYPLTIRMVS